MDITISAIDGWLQKTLPATSYVTEESDTSNGRLKSIVPKNTFAAPMSIWINESDACDVAFGRAFSRELGLDQGEVLFEWMEAVTRGSIVESIWSFGPRHLYSKSRIFLNGSTSTVRSELWLFYPKWLKKTYTYEAYA